MTRPPGNKPGQKEDTDVNRSYALLEAAISCGSASTGSEFAYDALMDRGLGDIFPGAKGFPMEKRPPCEDYPPKLLHLDTVMAVSRALRENMLEALEEDRYPIVIGGDHSIAMGTLAALGERYGAEQVALVYIDAHADINTEESSDSHRIHGMDLASACGLCCRELQVGKNRVNILGKNIHILGGRSIDPPEYTIMEEQGVHFHPAAEILERGMDAVLGEVLPALGGKKVYISFDVDSLDPAFFTSTGYLIPGGLTVEDVEKVFRGVLPLSVGFECVEYNPTLDETGRDAKTLLDLFSLAAERLAKPE